MLSQRSIGAGGVKGLPSDDEFNTVSFLSHFDGTNNGVNNVFDDSSTSNHTITANGNVTQGSFGPFARPDGEWAVSFDGSGDRLRTNAANLDVTTEAFTAEAWIFPSTDMDQYDIIACLFDLTHGSNANQTWSIRAGTSNTVEMITVSGGTQTILSAGTVNIGEWNHVAISRNGTTMYAALNGTVTSASCASSLNGHEYFYIGAADAGGSASYFFNGFISNVRYEIGNARYTSSYTPPSSALTATANTKLLTCQSNRFVDNSTSAHTITVSGNPAVSAFGPFLTSSVYDAGVNGASGYFDGSADYLTAPDSDDFHLANGDYTIEGWFYVKPQTYKQAIIGSWSNTDRGWQARVEPNSGGLRMRFTWTADGSTDYSEDGTIVFKYNEWNHLAWVKSGGTTTFYVNGVFDSSYNSSGHNIYNSSAALKVGDWDTNQADYDGYMFDVRLVKGTAVYTSAFTPPTAPLTAVTNTKLLLNMADGQAIDSAAQNNLTLYGNAKISSTQSKFGGTSMYFDGTGDYALFPNKSIGTGDFTIECWVRCLGTTYDKAVWDNHTSSASTDGLTLTRITEQEFRLFGTGELIRSGNFTITDTWVHVATVRSSGTLNLFVNGVSQGTTSFTTNLNSAEDFVIGGGRYGSGGPSDGAINAYIDDFRISSTARYTSNFTAPTEPFADKGQ